MSTTSVTVTGLLERWRSLVLRGDAIDEELLELRRRVDLIGATTTRCERPGTTSQSAVDAAVQATPPSESRALDTSPAQRTAVQAHDGGFLYHRPTLRFAPPRRRAGLLGRLESDDENDGSSSSSATTTTTNCGGDTGGCTVASPAPGASGMDIDAADGGNCRGASGTLAPCDTAPEAAAVLVGRAAIEACGANGDGGRTPRWTGPLAPMVHTPAQPGESSPVEGTPPSVATRLAAAERGALPSPAAESPRGAAASVAGVEPGGATGVAACHQSHLVFLAGHLDSLSQSLAQGRRGSPPGDAGVRAGPRRDPSVVEVAPTRDLTIAPPVMAPPSPGLPPPRPEQLPPSSPPPPPVLGDGPPAPSPEPVPVAQAPPSRLPPPPLPPGGAARAPLLATKASPAVSAVPAPLPGSPDVPKYEAEAQDLLARGEWKSAKDTKGRLYYFHVKEKKPCWNLAKELERRAKAVGTATPAAADV